jgi:hypothetical protein
LQNRTSAGSNDPPGGSNSVAGTKTLTTNTTGAHVHNYSGTTSSNGAHTHTLGGSTDTGGGHTHSLSGNTDATGSGTLLDTRPPFYALAYIMKL